MQRFQHGGLRVVIGMAIVTIVGAVISCVQMGYDMLCIMMDHIMVIAANCVAMAVADHMIMMIYMESLLTVGGRCCK